MAETTSRSQPRHREAGSRRRNRDPRHTNRIRGGAARASRQDTTKNLITGGDSAPAALTSGYHLAFIIGAALVVAAIGAAVTVLRPAEVPQAQAEVTEGEFGEGEPAYSEAA